MKAKPIPTSPRERLRDETPTQSAPREPGDVEDFLRQPPAIAKPTVIRFAPGFALFTVLIALVAGVLGAFLILTGEQKWPWLQRWIGQPDPASTVIRTTTARRDTQTVLADMAQKLSPNVVSIYVRSQAAPRDAALLDQLYLPEDRRGFGVILTEDGLGATARQAIPDLTREVAIVTETKQVFLTKQFFVDPASDLVFFRISGKGFPTVNFVQEDALAIGQEVFLLGRQATTTVIEPHQALLTALRTYRLIDRSYFLRSSDRLTDVHQTDQPSIAGSPYFTVGGELVGVATGTQADVIPATVFATALERLTSTGAITRNVLGVRAIDLAMAKGLLIAPADAGTEGAYLASDPIRNIAAVTPKSPAERAGLKAGDVILKVGDQTLTARQTLSVLIQAAGVRSSVQITYRRDGKEQTVPITLDVAKS